MIKLNTNVKGKMLPIAVHVAIIIGAYLIICLLSFSAFWGYSILFFHYFNACWDDFFASGALTIGVLSAIAIIPLTTWMMRLALKK